ncbi:MAG: hypothetical protein ACRC5A_04920 [Enterobacteriaceae bacterium]
MSNHPEPSKKTEKIQWNVFNQPKAFYLISSVELWERFGFYGLQAIIAIYLVNILHLSEADSFTLFASFSALAYAFVAIGCWLLWRWGRVCLKPVRRPCSPPIIRKVIPELLAPTCQNISVLY